jgi:VanZ family protein
MHAGLYAVLGMTLGYGRIRSLVPPPHLVVILVGVLYGATDELHQVFVRGRTPDLGDWIADIVGLVSGYFLIMSLVARRRTSTTPDHGVDASR